MQQQAGQSLTDHCATFKNQVEVIKHNGGSFGFECGVIDDHMMKEHGTSLAESTSNVHKLAAQKHAQGLAIAVAFLHGTNRRDKCGAYLEKLENDFTQSNNGYP